MPRIARTVTPGFPHHIKQRGNYQQVVFEENEDFTQYKSWLKDDDNKVIEAIRKNSLTGRPCGNDGFIGRIEGLLDRE